MKKNKILIADDHIVVIDGLKKMLEGNDYLEVKKIITHFDEIIPTLKFYPIDILLLDVNMNKKSTFEIVPEIKNLFTSLKIIAFTSYDTPALRKEAYRIGISAYLTKNTSRNVLLKTINNCLNNEKQSHQNKIQITDQQSIKDQFIITQILSERELQILRLVAKGNTSQQIGEELFISKNTVQWHRKNIIAKLQLQSAADMIKFAHEHGII